MRLGWLPSTRAGVLGTRGQCYRAQVRQLRAPPPPSRRPTTQNTEIGVGFGPEHLSLGRPRAEGVALCLGAFTCLYRSGWARRVRGLAA